MLYKIKWKKQYHYMNFPCLVFEQFFKVFLLTIIKVHCEFERLSIWFASLIFYTFYYSLLSKSNKHSPIIDSTVFFCWSFWSMIFWVVGMHLSVTKFASQVSEPTISSNFAQETVAVTSSMLPVWTDFKSSLWQMRFLGHPARCDAVIDCLDDQCPKDCIMSVIVNNSHVDCVTHFYCLFLDNCYKCILSAMILLHGLTRKIIDEDRKKKTLLKSIILVRNHIA